MLDNTRFFLYSRFHGKDKPVGSDYLRAIQVINNSEAELYKYGENPDVLIFMKVFMSPDFQFPKHFKGIKILDICDPMWLDGFNVVETAQAMDAITCPTETIANFMKQFHKNVHVIPDRFDLSLVPEPKKHTKPAKTVVWYGYSHNAELLKPAMHLIDELDLNLLVISNDDPILNRYSLRSRKWYTYQKYNEDTIYEDLQKADFAVLPEGARPQDFFKSNNKTIKANLAGLPVAKDADEVRLYMEPENRRNWFIENHATIKEQYDIRKSVDDYKRIIDEIAS